MTRELFRVRGESAALSATVEHYKAQLEAMRETHAAILADME